MDINDFFGGPSARPDHPDFWKLSSIILKYDGRIDEAPNDEAKQKVWDEAMAESGLDGESVVYMGLQRAMRALGVQTVGQAREHMGDLSRMASLYAEAVLLGVQHERESQH